MRSFKSLVLFQFAVLISGMFLFLVFSGFFTFKLASKYERRYVDRLSSILAENVKLIAEIYPNKYLIEESMRRAVEEIPALKGMCLIINDQQFCYPQNLTKKYSLKGKGIIYHDNEVVVYFPVYEEYASQLLERREEGLFLALFDRNYVSEFKNYWVLNGLIISVSFIAVGLLVIISIWLDIKGDFNRLQRFIDSLNKPDVVLTKPSKEDIEGFKLEEFRKVAELIVRLTDRISELKDSIKRLAITDPLTGLFNRNYLNLVVKESYVPFWRRKASPLTVALLDIDDFKLINDMYGHSKGDEVLQKLGRIVKETLRESDIPIRYGGEEILIVFPSSKKEEAVKAIERIRSRLREEDFGIGKSVTFSSGLADFPSDVSTPGEFCRLIEIADKRLYRAKKLGKNRDVLF